MSKLVLQKDRLDPALLAQIDAQIAEFDDPQANVIAILHFAQGLFGWLPPELQLYIANKLDLPAARIHGIVSFYSYFLEEPNGKYNVSVCLGTACFVKGAQAIFDRFASELKLKKGQKVTDDGLFSMNDVRCVGACGLAPVVRVNDKIYGHVKADDVPGILEHYRQLDKEERA